MHASLVSRNPSEIIRIFWFGAQTTVIIINDENGIFYISIFEGNYVLWNFSRFFDENIV